MVQEEVCVIPLTEFIGSIPAFTVSMAKRLRKNTEPRIDPHGSYIVVCVCVCVCTRLVPSMNSTAVSMFVNVNMQCKVLLVGNRKENKPYKLSLFTLLTCSNDFFYN